MELQAQLQLVGAHLAGMIIIFLQRSGSEKPGQGYDIATTDWSLWEEHPVGLMFWGIHDQNPLVEDVACIWPRIQVEIDGNFI